MSCAIVIPVRVGSTRLPMKPLADISGVPMIVRVVRCACEAAVGPVIVALEDERVAEALVLEDCICVETPSDLPSGSDRVWNALAQRPDLKRELIINLQGDSPFFPPDYLRRLVAEAAADYDVLTMAVPYIKGRGSPQPMMSNLKAPKNDTSKGETPKDEPSIVKVVCENHESLLTAQNPVTSRALYFSRASIPHGTDDFLHHVGIYAWQSAALEKFVAARPSYLERAESLEQLRLLEMGLSVGVHVVQEYPHSVDTPNDLQRAREIAALADACG